MAKSKSTARHNQSAPKFWAMALVGAGFLLLVACEMMAAVGQFHTANRSVLIAGLPVDALGKVSLAVVVGFGAFGGAIVTTWLWNHHLASLRRQSRIALAATLALFGFAAFNQATYFGWARRMSEYQAVAHSPEYAQAQTDYAETSHRLAGEPLGYEEEDVVTAAQKRAHDVLMRGQKPTGSELPDFLDWLKAFAAYSIIELMAAGFRLPDSVKNPKKAVRSQSNRGRGDGKVVPMRR